MNTSKIITSLALLGILFTPSLRLAAQPREKAFTVQTAGEGGGGGSAGTLATTEAPGAGQVISFRPAPGANRDMMFISGPDGGAQPLVIASSAVDPAAMAEIDEDLKIMGKLVGDAATDDADEQRAMGIPVTYLPRNTSRPMYVEGYGVIFQTSVRFPLMPSEKEEPQTPPVNTNSAWDNARHELNSGPGGPDEFAGMPKREPYNADRVQSLKNSLLKALANANHVRQLKPNDKVIIVVRNDGFFHARINGVGYPGMSVGTSLQVQLIPARTEDNPDSTSANSTKKPDANGKPEGAKPRFTERLRQIIGHASGGGPDKTLTISVKKSDADALADGKISEDEFNKRASMVTY